MKKKFDIEFTNIEHGWMGITYKFGNREIYTSGSGVFNPMVDFENLVISLKNKTKYTMWYDQEGYDFEFEILNYNKNSVLVSLCNWKDRTPRFRKFKNNIEKYRYYKNTKKYFLVLNRMDLIKILTKRLTTWDRKVLQPYLKSNEEKCDFYDFYFDVKKVKYGKILNKGFFNIKYKYLKDKRIYPIVNNN